MGNHSSSDDRAASMQCPRVLEIGTGTGMLSGFLALSRVEVTSIHLDASVLGVAEQFHQKLGVTVESNGPRRHGHWI